MQFWDEDDFKNLGLNRYGIDINELVQTQTKIFRAWLEEWEELIIAVNDLVNQARLLEKYGGMVWFDPDLEEVVTASAEKMFFNQKRGERGYCVLALKANWHEGDADDAETWEPWTLSTDLYKQIQEYYETNPHPHIQIVRQEEEECNKEASSTSEDNSD